MREGNVPLPYGLPLTQLKKRFLKLFQISPKMKDERFRDPNRLQERIPLPDPGS